MIDYLTNAEINERVALAMGWTTAPPMWAGGERQWVHPKWKGDWKRARTLPDFLRDDAAFVALLRWHAENGRSPTVKWDSQRLIWVAFTYGEYGETTGLGTAATPHRALALATIAVPR